MTGAIVSWGMKPSGSSSARRKGVQGNGDEPWIHQVHSAARMPGCIQLLTGGSKHERPCQLCHATAARQMAEGPGHWRWTLDT